MSQNADRVMPRDMYTVSCNFAVVSKFFRVLIYFRNEKFTCYRSNFEHINVLYLVYVYPG